MPDKISRTALSMALFRAIETAGTGRRKLVDDPYAALFLPSGFASVARIAEIPLLQPLVERIIDWRYPGARSSGVARTRLIDDWLVAEAVNGLDQMVVLGAGFDARSMRLHEFASIPVFELDRESVLAEKDRALERSVSALPDNRMAVPIDFLQDSITEKLLAAGFQRTARTVVLWEGVTNYLTRLAVTDVFRTFANLSSPGTSIIFTYIHKDVLASTFESVGLERLQRRLARWGEPWTFGFHPEELPGFLEDLDYVLTDDVGADEYRQTYYGVAAARFHGYEFYRVAKAISGAATRDQAVEHAPR